MATVLSCVWGLYAFSSAPRREDPSLTIRTAVISTRWPGATALALEQLVTDPIEEAMASLDEVRKVTSDSSTGRSSVFVSLEEVESVDNVWDKVRGKLEQVAPDLPEGCSTPLLNTEFVVPFAMLLAIHQTPQQNADAATRYTPRQLEVFAERIKDELRLLEAVGRIDLIGVQEEAIYLETAAGNWSHLGLTTDGLRGLLERRNIVAPGGSIDTELGMFGVKPTGEFGAVEQIQRVSADSGQIRAPVYLRDLGLRTTRDYREPATQIVRYGDALSPSPAIVIGLTMKEHRNVVALGGEVRASLEALRSRLPADLEIQLASDQSHFVDEVVSSFISNLVQAVLIVILVTYLLVGIRLALVIAASIPIVFVASVGIVRLFGVELEQISIASMIVSLGLLVDCAIEVGDNIHRLLEEGLERVDAAVTGAQQIAFPVLIATLTTVAGFLPMLGLPDLQGDYIRSLPIVISSTLLLSWVIAMTTTTLMGYFVMRPGTEGGSPLAALLRVLGLSERLRVGGTYTRLLNRCLRYKTVVPLVALSTLVAAISLVPLGFIGTQYFPEADRSQFVVDLYLPEGSPIARTDRATKQVEALVREHARGRLINYTSYVGGGSPRFRLNMNPEQPASNVAQILVNTTDAAAASAFVDELRQATRAQVAGARVVPHKMYMGPPIDSPIALRIFGEDADRLREVANRVKDALRATPGTWDVHDTWGDLGYQLSVVVDEDKANQAGVSNAQVAQTLNAFFSGHYLTTYREGEHQVPIYLRLPAQERNSLDRLHEVYVEGKQGKVPLDAVAEVKPVWSPSKIWRWKQHRMLEVRAEVLPGHLANVVLGHAMPRLRELEREFPAGFRLEVGGEQEETTKSQRDIAKALLVSFFLIILCLVINYNALLKPLMIMFMVPLAGTGALLGLLATGLPLGFMSLLGLLSLAGVVLNDDLVLIEFIEHSVRERIKSGDGLAAPGERSCAGLTRAAFRECVVQGGKMRLLPIWLTTLTTVGGLIPLFVFGGPLWQPLAAVIIAGLIVATAFTLFVLPCVYAVLVENFGVTVPNHSKAEAEAGTEAGTETGTEAGAEAGTETGTETGTEAGAEAGTGTEAGAEAEAESDASSDSETEA